MGCSSSTEIHGTHETLKESAVDDVSSLQNEDMRSTEIAVRHGEQCETTENSLMHRSSVELISRCSRISSLSEQNTPIPGNRQSILITSN